MAVGGRTMPIWASGRRPAWFPEEFDWVVGCTYKGIPSGLVRVRNVLGGNASFRRSAFDAAGGFATGIGRDGDKRPLGCEETELCIRLSRARPDAVLLIDDRAVIHHRVPEAREHFGYFRTRAYAEGLSKALVARSVGADKGLESERRYATRVLPAGVVRGLRDAALSRPGGAGRAGAIVAGVLTAAGGYVVGTVRARRGGATFTVADIEENKTTNEEQDRTLRIARRSQASAAHRWWPPTATGWAVRSSAPTPTPWLSPSRDGGPPGRPSRRTASSWGRATVTSVPCRACGCVTVAGPASCRSSRTRCGGWRW